MIPYDVPRRSMSGPSFMIPYEVPGRSGPSFMIPYVVQMDLCLSPASLFLMKFQVSLGQSSWSFMESRSIYVWAQLHDPLWSLTSIYVWAQLHDSLWSSKSAWAQLHDPLWGPRSVCIQLHDPLWGPRSIWVQHHASSVIRVWCSSAKFGKYKLSKTVVLYNMDRETNRKAKVNIHNNNKNQFFNMPHRNHKVDGILYEAMP